MATANRTAPKKAHSRTPSSKSRRKAARKLPDLSAILHRFSSALAIVTVALVAIEALDADESIGCEATALRAGVAALDGVYDELDRADIGLRRFLKSASKAVQS